MKEEFKMFLLVFIGMVILVALFGFHKSPTAGSSIGGTTSSKATTEKTSMGL